MVEENSFSAFFYTVRLSETFFWSHVFMANCNPRKILRAETFLGIMGLFQKKIKVFVFPFGKKVVSES